jgi:PAS domain S-box-containing protein
MPVKSRATGAWTIYLARRIGGPKGEFLGAVVGAIDIRYFEDFYAAITLNKDSAVAVLRRDSTILARYPHIETMIGATMATESPFYASVATNGGTFRSPGYLDHVARVVSVHPLREYPLVVSVSVSEDSVLAEWRRQSLFIAIGSLCAVVGFATLFWALAAQFRRLEQSESSLAAQNTALAVTHTRLEIRTFELQRAAEALRESEARLLKSKHHLARAQEVADLGSFEGNLFGGNIIWSDNLYKIFGVDRESFVICSESVLALVHPDDRASYEANYRDCLAGGAPAKFEYRVIRPSSECRHVLRESEPIHDERGNVVGLFGTVRDVTSAKAAEAERRELEAHLQHSQRIEALGTLAGGIAHDLNNTLVPVVALSKLMLGTLPKGSRERANLNMIHQAGARARDLVKQILAFSRRDTPVREVLDLSAFVSDALPLLRAVVPATIDIDYAADGAPPPLLGDPSQLHQVLINLVTNGAQAIGDKMGRIVITVAWVELSERPGGARPSASPALRLSVRDTGCGMDQATMDRMFQPFFTTKNVGEGTGLGLAVVHGIVGSHGGRIEVRSAVGSGSQFDIFLPAIQPPAATGVEAKPITAIQASSKYPSTF